MPHVSANFSAAQSGRVLAAAVPGRVLLVRRVLISAESAGNFALLSAAGGTSQQSITPAWWLRNGRVLDLELERSHGIATNRGESLGLKTVLAGPNYRHGVLIWYEVLE